MLDFVTLKKGREGKKREKDEVFFFFFSIFEFIFLGLILSSGTFRVL